MGWVEQKIEHLAEAVTIEGEKTRAELSAAFGESLRGVRLAGALSRPVRSNAINYGTAGRLVGWSMRASGGDVTLTFRDGRNTDADPLASVVIPAGTSSTIGLPGSGVGFVCELYADVTGAGTPVGAVWIGAGD